AHSNHRWHRPPRHRPLGRAPASANRIGHQPTDLTWVALKPNTVNLRHLPGAVPVQSCARSVHFAAKTAAGWTETSRGPATNGLQPGTNCTHTVSDFAARRYGEPDWVSKSCVRLKVNGIASSPAHVRVP